MAQEKTKAITAEEIPPGFKLRHTLRGHTGGINRIAWSPDGRRIASPSLDGTARIWDAETGKEITVLGEGKGSHYSVAWSPDGRMLASASGNLVLLWRIEDGELVRALKGHKATVYSIVWLPRGHLLASGSGDGTVRIWDIETAETVQVFTGHTGPVLGLTSFPDGQTLASGAFDDDMMRLWGVQTMKRLAEFEMSDRTLYDLAWSPDRRILAAGAKNTIEMWGTETRQQMHMLEGHTGTVTGLSFSYDSRLLASKSRDDTMWLWRTDTWLPVAKLLEQHSRHPFSGLAFHPTTHVLATLGENDTVIRIWDLNYNALLAATLTPIVKYTSAKIVLVGESNVGKSCLAMRLAEDRYPDEHEHGTTHGMRFWPLEPEQLHPSAVAPEGQRRDVMLWDLGGQDEYRLVHQLFLHDTTLALLLMDPTRGRAAFKDVEAWNKRLEKQLRGRAAVKLLVGSKMDQPSALIDRQGLEGLLRECGFAGYYETSAKIGRGIPELREAMAAALDWDRLAKTSRPELFQRIRDEIESCRERGEVVLNAGDLNRHIRKQTPELYDPKAVEAVAGQLAAQGVVALTQLDSGEQVLVLQIGEVERYAGSLIVTARENARGVPALEERDLASPDVPLPGIKEAQRLPRLQERVVLECVVQLLVEHGVCFQHEGLLIFPSLFQPTERDEGGEFPHAVSLYYDFAGAIDNIYASLVAHLVIGETFGRVRLWQDRAEFDAAGQGVCGLRKVERGGGFAHVDVYFEDQTSQELRERFISFVEEHLRQHGVEIVEHVEITCACGFRFPEGSIRRRIAQGDEDIGCPECDRRTRITEGAKTARERDPDVARDTWALRTEIERRKKQIVASVKQVFGTPDEEMLTDEPIRILHLSDLHFGPDVDWRARLLPLVADVRDEAGGLGFRRLDYLVISGDLTNRAAPEEFEAAFEFVSGLISRFELTAERCIIVPGNHDLSWDEDVYDWKPERQAGVDKLPDGHYCPQGSGYLIRDEQRYPNRFKNFTHHFYHPLVQKEYPLAFKKQCLPTLFEETGIQFITLNSAWQIDEWFKGRAGVYPGVVARGLAQAEEDVGKAKRAGRLAEDGAVLRIGVWHHPVTGNEKIRDDAFLEQLRQADVELCLHGHVHEDRADLAGYLHRRKIRVAGAGAFGAVAKHRPESTPRLYNLLVIPRDHRSIKVHTRCMPKAGGAWRGWPVWEGAAPNEWRSYYTIDLEER